MGLHTFIGHYRLDATDLCHADYRVAVGLLIGQGWEQRRPTLPNLYVGKARPKALVFLHLNNLFGEGNG